MPVWLISLSEFGLEEKIKCRKSDGALRKNSSQSS